MAEPNYPIVDYIVKQEGPGTYNVYFKDFDNADVDSIKAWLKDNIEYSDVKQAPILPADINNSSNAYHDVEHAPNAEHNSTWTTRELNDLKVVAFSGDYKDLDNAIEIPSELDAPNAYENGVLKPLNEMAFTGRVNLNSIEVSHVLDLTTYTISNDVSENSKLQYLGAEDTFIKGYGVGTAGQRLSTAVSILVDNFQNNKRPCFIVSNSGYFFVLSATAYMGGSDTPRYHKIVVSEVIDANYPFEVQADITDEQAEEKLNSITISSKQITFIFDLTNKIIYCKTKTEDISNATIQASQISGLKSVATSGNYEDLSNKPTIITSYNDLDNKPTIPSININSIQNTGTKIATITINNIDTDLYETDYSQKRELMYIDITENPYNLVNFGIANFTLVEDLLFDTLYDNYISKQIIIRTDNGNFDLVSLNMSDDYDFAIFEKKSTNYLDIINYIVQEANESPSDYENRLTQYLYDNINDYFYKVYYIRDSIKNKIYCIFKIGTYVDMNKLEQILESGDE